MRVSYGSETKKKKNDQKAILYRVNNFDRFCHNGYYMVVTRDRATAKRVKNFNLTKLIEMPTMPFIRDRYSLVLPRIL